MIYIFQREKSCVGGGYSSWEKKKEWMKTMNRSMSCFKKSNDGNKEIIILTIAKQLWQPTLAGKSQKLKISF